MTETAGTPGTPDHATTTADGGSPPPQVWPTLRADDARGLIAFLVAAFGFVEVVAWGDQPDGGGEHVVHAQLAWPEGGGIMLGSTRPPAPGHRRRVGAAAGHLRGLRRHRQPRCRPRPRGRCRRADHPTPA